jgi:hypothetical protein
MIRRMGLFSRKSSQSVTDDEAKAASGHRRDHDLARPKRPNAEAAPPSRLMLSQDEAIGMNMIWIGATQHAGVLPRGRGLSDSDLWSEIGTIFAFFNMDEYDGDVGKTVAAFTPERVERMLRYDGTGPRP